MKIVVATDIFGSLPLLTHWFKPMLQATNDRLEVVSPYPSSLSEMKTDRDFPLGFAELAETDSADQMAYQLFLQQGGMSAYVTKLQSVLNMQQGNYLAIGFSAGAAALWQLAAKPQSGLEQIFCFYGGQIRNCAQLKPCIPTTLIWAQEAHFDVAALHQRIQQHQRVKSYLTPYPHGFINPASDGFDAVAADFYQQWLVEQLSDTHQSQQ